MKGKIVIADASTLIGLLRIGQLSLLEKLFGKIIIPRGVYDEVGGVYPFSEAIYRGT